MLEMTRDSSSGERVRGCGVGVAEGSCSWDCGCWEKDGSRSHDDQEVDEGAALVGCEFCAAVGAAAAAVVDCAARACRACCNHSSRVLSSTGHLASSPVVCAPAGPNPFMLDVLAVAVAVPAVVDSTALFPKAVASLRPTKTVSSRSVCIMRMGLLLSVSIPVMRLLMVRLDDDDSS